MKSPLGTVLALILTASVMLPFMAQGMVKQIQNISESVSALT